MGPVVAKPPVVKSDIDQRVYFRNAPWSYYEILLALRGESAVPRITYLAGDIELMTPSHGHETTKEGIGRLLEAYAREIGIKLCSTGSWTLKDSLRERGCEGDKSYVVGTSEAKDHPDLVIEVAWSRGGIDKLEIYRGLRIPELWFWEEQRMAVFVLTGEDYARGNRSRAFPDLDVDLVARLAGRLDQDDAISELLAEVRKRRTT